MITAGFLGYSPLDFVIINKQVLLETITTEFGYMLQSAVLLTVNGQ